MLTMDPTSGSSARAHPSATMLKYQHTGVPLCEIAQKDQFPWPILPPFFAAFGNSILTSADGFNWDRRIESNSENFHGAAYGGHRIVVVSAAGNAAVSVDGVEWVQVDADSLNGVFAVEYGSGRFVAVGEVFNEYGLVGTVSTSPDGLNWDDGPEEILPGIASLAHGQDIFVAVGSGEVIVSRNGIDWSATEFDAPIQLFDVSYGNNTFVISGGRGTIFTSTDGLNWSEQSTGLSRRVFLAAITYGNGVFVAVGKAGVGKIAQSQAVGQGYRQKQSDVGDQIVVVKGDLDPVGVNCW